MPSEQLEYGDRPGKLRVVIDHHAQIAVFQLGELAVQCHVPRLRCDLAEQPRIAVVVTEHHVHWPLEPGRHLPERKRRTEVAAENQLPGLTHHGERFLEFPDVVMNV